MPAASVMIGCLNGGAREVWKPTTLDVLGQSEEFLEALICEQPELLQLESRRSGIRGPFRVFRQVGFATPLGRPIYADVVFLAASGHVIVVEVKRHSNPELRDRAVIAQIIDYASSFSALSSQQLCKLFSTKGQPAHTWDDLVIQLFPDERDAEELAQHLLNRFRNGELNLVLVCDRVPPGLPELISGIASQKTLGFDLDLVEITPFSKIGDHTSAILFVPVMRLATEIVARTAISVTYRQGDPQPEVVVETTSMEEIEERVLEAKKSGDAGRIWTATEVEEEARRIGEPIAIELFEFCKRHSDEGRLLAPGRRINAGFGFYLRGQRPDGMAVRRCVFNCTPTRKSVYIYMNFVVEIAGLDAAEQFRQRLKEIFGDAFNTEAKETFIPLRAVGEHWSAFQDALKWLTFMVEHPAG